MLEGSIHNQPPEFIPPPPSFQESNSEIAEIYYDEFNLIREYAIERRADDPVDALGYIYDLPKNYVGRDTPNYSRYICRGGPVNALATHLYWFMDDPGSPLAVENKRLVKSLYTEIQKIYHRRDSNKLDDQGKAVKAYRTKEELVKFKENISQIVSIIEQALYTAEKKRVAAA